MSNSSLVEPWFQSKTNLNFKNIFRPEFFKEKTKISAKKNSGLKMSKNTILPVSFAKNYKFNDCTFRLMINQKQCDHLGKDSKKNKKARPTIEAQSI